MGHLDVRAKGVGNMSTPSGLDHLSSQQTPAKDLQDSTAALQRSGASHLQQSAASTALNRSTQMRVTNERLAKLEQMYEELSLLEAKADKRRY